MSIFQEKIYSIIERGVKSVGKVVQKRNKGNNLKFQILPSNQSSQGGGDSLDSSSEAKDKGPLWLGVGLAAILTLKYVILQKYYFSKPVNEKEKQSKEHKEIELLERI